jgi:hypothetical protein
VKSWKRVGFGLVGLAALSASVVALAQPPGGEFPPFGGGFPPGQGGGRFGGPPGMNQEIKLVKQFDKDGDKRLNNAERKAARAFLRSGNGGGRRFGPPPGMFRRENQEPPKAGVRVTPADVSSHSDAALYEPKVLRTLFLEFENADWEQELEDFHGTDVEVPATLTVDGKKYLNVAARPRI